MQKDDEKNLKGKEIFSNEEIYLLEGNYIVTIYFKRGLMPDESNDNDSNQQINFEGITTKSNIPVTITLYAMKYDLSSPDTNYESYTVVSSFSTSYTMKY